MNSWLMEMILPVVLPGFLLTLLGYLWTYVRASGINIDQQRIDMINKIAEARAGEFFSGLLTGKVNWAMLATFAVEAANIAITGNPKLAKATKLNTEGLAKRIEASVGKMASLDPTIATPPPPAGALVGNVAAAGVAAPQAVKEAVQMTAVQGETDINVKPPEPYKPAKNPDYSGR